MPRPDASAAVSVERFFQFALLGLVASGFLAVAGSGYIDLPTIVLTAAGLCLRAVAVAGWVRLELSERTVTVVTSAYALFFLADLFLLSRELLGAAVHLVFFLAVVKVLTAKVGRDYLHIAGIAFLELLAAALLSIDFNFILSLTLYLLFAMAALTSAEIRRSMAKSTATARGGFRRFHLRLGGLAVCVALGIMAVTATLFFTLPRTAEAAFSRFARRTALPGFSSEVTLGDIARIKTTSQPVMHIAVFGRETPGALKWRGAALADFDGRRWTNLKPARTPVTVDDGHADLAPSAAGRGRYLTYNVNFDSLDAEALFFAGVPEKLDLRTPFSLFRTEEDNFVLARRPPDGFQYEVWGRVEDPPESMPPAYPAPVLRLEARQRYLEVPSRLDPRIAGLARTMAAGAGTDLERSRAIERALRRDYAYSLRMDDEDAPDPLAHFLFTGRKGYCEYFASAMAVMLRTAGIPSRIVTGFQSGEYNPMTDLWVIRASDAHSWVEAWIPGYGWSVFDPTPPDPNARRFGLLDKFGLYLDTAQTFWRDWVVGYDIGRQGTLADRIERGARRMGIRWFDAITAIQSGWSSYSSVITRKSLIRAAVLIALAVWIWLLTPRLLRLLRIRRRVERVRRGQAVVGDATLLYERMLDILKRQGYQKPAWFTPAEFAASLPPGAMGAAVLEFTSAYNAFRFGGRTEAAPRLTALLDQLEHRP